MGTYVNTRSAAAILSISPKTLEKLRTDGGGPRYSKLAAGKTGAVRYCVDDLHEWMKTKSVSSTSERR